MSIEDSPLSEAMFLATSWRESLSVIDLTRARLGDFDGTPTPFDVVALGKAAPEMADAVSSVLSSVRRRFIVSEIAVVAGPDDVCLAGEHPVPGPGSELAGRRILDFLAAPGDAGVTLFCVSGGASSLCVAPAPPLDPDDLAVIWDRAVEKGWDITRLNRARAATSLISGGAVLRHVRTPRSRSLVMVDNVVGGAAWVASGLTYEFRPTAAERGEIVTELGPLPERIERRFAAGLSRRDDLMAGPVTTDHENRVLVEPDAALAQLRQTAQRRGLATHSMGMISDDVESVVSDFARVLTEAPLGEFCVAGVGEVTVRVSGDGSGGRCQEFALRMGEILAGLGRPGACVALATDGRDFIEGVGGAWSDETTPARLAALGVDVRSTIERHDAHDALAAVGQLVQGGRTGWNLCDLYVVVLGPGSPVETRSAAPR